MWIRNFGSVVHLPAYCCRCWTRCPNFQPPRRNPGSRRYKDLWDACWQPLEWVGSDSFYRSHYTPLHINLGFLSYLSHFFFSLSSFCFVFHFWCAPFPSFHSYWQFRFVKTKEGRRGRKEREEEKSYQKEKKKKRVQPRQFVPNTVKGGWGVGEGKKKIKSLSIKCHTFK